MDKLKAYQVDCEGLHSYYYWVDAVGPLGIPFKIGAKSLVMHHPTGYTLRKRGEVVSICIHIGENHSADLVMSKEAFDALHAGVEPQPITYQQFREKNPGIFVKE